MKSYIIWCFDRYLISKWGRDSPQNKPTVALWAAMEGSSPYGSHGGDISCRAGSTLFLSLVLLLCLCQTGGGSTFQHSLCTSSCGIVPPTEPPALLFFSPQPHYSAGDTPTCVHPLLSCYANSTHKALAPTSGLALMSSPPPAPRLCLHPLTAPPPLSRLLPLDARSSGENSPTVSEVSASWLFRSDKNRGLIRAWDKSRLTTPVILPCAPRRRPRYSPTPSSHPSSDPAVWWLTLREQARGSGFERGKAHIFRQMNMKVDARGGKSYILCWSKSTDAESKKIPW